MIAPSPYFQSVLILILLEVTQISSHSDGEVIMEKVLILILLEVTQILVWMVVCAGIGVCLNPYSTGSNSNVS